MQKRATKSSRVKERSSQRTISTCATSKVAPPRPRTRLALLRTRKAPPRSICSGVPGEGRDGGRAWGRGWGRGWWCGGRGGASEGGEPESLRACESLPWACSAPAIRIEPGAWPAAAGSRWKELRSLGLAQPRSRAARSRWLSRVALDESQACEGPGLGARGSGLGARARARARARAGGRCWAITHA